MASQVVSADKRYRISLLLDAYGELLTDKQRTFLRHYYEEDLSFGEIAREYGVSRQAIFDSVKHGEDAMEQFETALRLVGSGWLALLGSGLTPAAMAERLGALRRQAEQLEGPGHQAMLAGLDALIGQFNNPDGALASGE